jgi:hypothetical protein
MGTRKFKPGQTRTAGHVFYVPKEARLAEDTKNRRHLLLHDASDEGTAAVLATLVHLTTKDTEHRAHHAPFYRLTAPALQRSDPKAQGSYVNAPRLVFRDVRKLIDAVGEASNDDMEGARRAVADALGITRQPPHPESVRGRIAQVAGTLQKDTGFAFGVVLTNPAYSAERRFQAMVPIIDLQVLLREDEIRGDFVPDDTDVLPGNRAWCARLPKSWTEPLIDTVRLVTLTEEWKQSRNKNAWLPKQITILDQSVDDETLHEIESRLAQRLGLRADRGEAAP